MIAVVCLAIVCLICIKIGLITLSKKWVQRVPPARFISPWTNLGVYYRITHMYIRFVRVQKHRRHIYVTSRYPSSTSVDNLRCSAVSRSARSSLVIFDMIFSCRFQWAAFKWQDRLRCERWLTLTWTCIYFLNHYGYISLITLSSDLSYANIMMRNTNEIVVSWVLSSALFGLIFDYTLIIENNL